MPNTYTQIHIHAVFTVQNRECLIKEEWENKLHSYIIGIIKENRHKPIIINGMPDHLHVLFGLRPSQSISDLMKDIKGASSKWVNDNSFIRGRFSWQESYGAFSYSKSDLEKVIRYIKNQKEHHKRKSFREEYIELLKEFEIDFDEKYLFKPVDN